MVLDCVVCGGACVRKGIGVQLASTISTIIVLLSIGCVLLITILTIIIILYYYVLQRSGTMSYRFLVRHNKSRMSIKVNVISDN
jgi:hypothetical protein